jgi:hypothetical protein
MRFQRGARSGALGTTMRFEAEEDALQVTAAFASAILAWKI